VFLVNSRLSLFSAAPSSSRTQGPFTLPGRPFSRSYGANLPSSLTRAHPFPLVLSHPATSVGLRYGHARPPVWGFSWGRAPTELASLAGSLSPASGLRPARLDAASPAPRSAMHTPSPKRTLTSARGDGISTVCPSPTLFSLGLGPTHPPRMGLPEETSAIRGPCFSQGLRYSCRHSHSRPLHQPFQASFTAVGTLPYHDPPTGGPSAASAPGLAPLHYRRARTRPVSCYALFKGWLLLSQPPGCLCTRTSFTTEPGLRGLS
jgi:hypothetical protein